MVHCKSPYPDIAWKEVANFLEQWPGHGRVVAPIEFRETLGALFLDPQLLAKKRFLAEVHLVVLHKGRLSSLPSSFLPALRGQFQPVFANELFIAFARPSVTPSPTPCVPLFAPHLAALQEAHPLLLRKMYLRLRAFAAKLLRLGTYFFWRHPAFPIMRMYPRKVFQIVLSQFLRPAVYIGNHLALTRDLLGHSFVVDTRDVTIGYPLLLTGFWEPAVTALLNQILRPGFHVVEIGANLGYHTVFMASKIGPYGKLWAFEPDPRAFQLLGQNLDMNGLLDRVVPIQKAVFKTTGPITFRSFEKHLVLSGLFTSDHAAEKPREIVVDGTSLDDFFLPGTHVDILRMDAEGAEFFILEGAERIFSENANLKIVMEFNQDLIRKAGFEPSVCLEYLLGKKFSISILGKRGKPRRASLEEILNCPLCELYLVPNKRRL
jgi:FkbM family methyltransferase